MLPINRLDSINRLAPNLFTNNASVLYVGARTDRFDLSVPLKNSNAQITVLEIFEPNIKYLKTLDFDHKVIQGDVRNVATDIIYDNIIWWHGPEHIQKTELAATLSKLEEICKNIILLGCPWGIYKQGHLHNNPHEEHVSHYDGATFRELGYTVECLGEKNVQGSNITSIKYMETK